MNTNINNIDRILRLVLGTFLIIWGVYHRSWWGGIGIVPLMTGALEYCPLYTLLGISTNHEFHRTF